MRFESIVALGVVPFFTIIAAAWARCLLSQDGCSHRSARNLLRRSGPSAPALRAPL
jgi:hypothetical protein